MKVGITFNLRKTFSERDSVFDSPKTIEDVKLALTSLGHRVKLYEADSETLFYILKIDRPQIVFNMAEGRFGVFGESFVPALLDELKIPYTGSGVQGTLVAVNKVFTKLILQSIGISVPKLYQVVNSLKEEITPIDKFPVIVKPVFEGASIGIKSKSICYSQEEVDKAVLKLKERLGNRPVMIEEFIDGVEVTVGVIGNFPPKSLPPMEIDFSPLNKRELNATNGIQTFTFKTNYSEKANYYLPARFPPEVNTHIQKMAVKAFEILGLRDIARFDVRVDKDFTPYFIEVNAIVGLEKEHSDFPRMYKMLGYDYNDLIKDILNSALERVKNNMRVTY
ncbi:D-alanine--D-alanine ligase family protein [Caldisericum exile]|uniref:D-alanine--D-alanine ligase n=1 Tax=Caldisericum exile (strain DSM 21853 / NBRC 104410 / AZM16c01) TaxID=511051 RepID=A0A7U6JH56_CALEA|nr:D-alanine--D-alanine ligase [Caldisericum exile]BAL81472.1 putative D-alanine--D-alanine ligase [Caldisericum exile AZM16c01]